MTSTAPAPRPAPLRVVPPSDVDLARAEQAAATFLAALGVETDSDATAATPRRRARAYAEMLRPRVVELFARRPQVQDRLTTQVADGLQAHLQPRGVGVVVEAEHPYMTLRGVQVGGTRTTTSTLRGALREDARSRAEFLALTASAGTRR